MEIVNVIWSVNENDILNVLLLIWKKNVYSLPVQLKDKFRFVCSDCGVETVLDGEYIW